MYTWNFLINRLSFNKLKNAESNKVVLLDHDGMNWKSNSCKIFKCLEIEQCTHTQWLIGEITKEFRKYLGMSKSKILHSKMSESQPGHLVSQLPVNSARPHIISLCVSEGS